MTHAIQITILFVAIFVASCKGTSSATNAKPDSPSKNGNESSLQGDPKQGNSSSTPAESASAKIAGGAPQLAGTYMMTEIHDKGVVNIISEVKTVIHFSPTGSYDRVSAKDGTMYHSDSGRYAIEGEDKLVLSIQMSKKEIHNPPLKKEHQFTLSPGGEELRLTSGDGKVAVFRRTDTPQK